MKDVNKINIQDISEDNAGDFYENFRQKLQAVEQFPMLYTFKFIVPAAQNANAAIEKIFEHPSTKVQVRDSKTGKYNSLTIETFVNTADDVIRYYKSVSAIDNVMML